VDSGSAALLVAVIEFGIDLSLVRLRFRVPVVAPCRARRSVHLSHSLPIFFRALTCIGGVSPPPSAATSPPGWCFSPQPQISLSGKGRLVPCTGAPSRILCPSPRS